MLVLKLKKEKNGTKTQLWKLNKTQQQKKLIESTIKRFKIAVDKLIIFYSHPIIYENYIEKNILMLYHYGPISFRKKIFFYYKISGSNDYYEWHDFRHDFTGSSGSYIEKYDNKPHPDDIKNLSFLLFQKNIEIIYNNEEIILLIKNINISLRKNYNIEPNLHYIDDKDVLINNIKIKLLDIIY